MVKLANVSVDDLARLIAKDLEEYTEEAEAKVEEVIQKVTKEALQAVRDSPAIQHIKDTYGKSLYAKDIYKSKGKNKGFYRMVIASKRYQIAHLLESGHQIFTGETSGNDKWGRANHKKQTHSKGGRTKELPHFINGQKIADTLPQRIKEALSK